MTLFGKLLQDSRGRESITLSLVVPAWFVLLVKFVLAGVTLPGVGVTVPPMSATEFGLAMAGVLAIWLGREWAEKKGN
jgi:tellurite resistance protein TehA-like permease